jgi:hypothetical protein
MTPRIDWFRVLTDLDRAGYSGRMVSATLGIPYTTLKAWLYNGSDPRFQDGEAVVGLWIRVTQRAMEDVPRTGEAERITTARDR